MSGVFGILNIGKSGIEANEAGLSTSGQNVSNVNTPGYSVEEVHYDQSIPNNGNPGMVGTGVRATGIHRVVNSFLETQLTRQKTRMGYWEASRLSLSELDTYFSHAQNQGLSKDISRFLNGWEVVANHPLDRAARSTLLTYGKNLSEDFHQMAALYSQTKNRLGDMVTSSVVRINADMKKIAELNREILQAQAGGQSPNTLIDQRQHLVESISQLTNAHFFHDKNGAVTLHLGGQAAITDIDSGTLKEVYDSSHDRYRILIIPPGFSGTPIDITDRIHGGKIGGYLDVRDRKIAALQAHLNTLAHGLINHVNVQHVQGYGLNGKTNLNFFLPTVTVKPQEGTSSGITVTANVVDPGQNTGPVDVSVSGNKLTVTDERTGKLLKTVGLSDGVQTVRVSGYSIRVVSGGGNASGRFQVSGGSDTKGAALSMMVSDLHPEDLAVAFHPVKTGQNQGDNRNAHLLFGLLQDHVKFVGQDQPVSFHDFFATGVSEVGSWSRNARDHYMAQSLIQKGLENQRLSVSGVSIANESAKIIQYEKAYQASANLIHMTNRILETLVHLPSQST